ncbi:MAG TPA: hypothetical protein ENJ95_19520 [Bacteroidetes bacterium]|nr:hypothetical protein [Bacteroidota bacterium]
MKQLLSISFGLSLLLIGCIGDDLIFDEVDEAVRILNPLDTLAVGEMYQFETLFTNNVGKEEERPVVWTSSDAAVLGIDENGLCTALAKGTCTVTATVEIPGEPSVSDSFDLVVDEETVVAENKKSGTIKSTSSYALQGTFEITESGDGILISINDDYQATTILPALYVYLGNNPSSIGDAFEIQAVEVFQGAHTYQVDGVGINDYQYILYWCKPFGVKVGEGLIE